MKNGFIKGMAFSHQPNINITAFHMQTHIAIKRSRPTTKLIFISSKRVMFSTIETNKNRSYIYNVSVGFFSKNKVYNQ